MAGELVYTSVPKGLNKGESGFCVVARSAAISPMLLNRLEAMSGYREIFSAIDPKAQDNPVNFAHTLIVCGRERFRVVSRVGFAGLDYSGRSNKIADHLILTEAESDNAGPAELLSIRELFYTKWDTSPIILPENAKLIPTKTVVPGLAEYWHEVTGDMGWAEHLIELSRRNIDKSLYIMTKPGIDNLLLVREALRLLPLNEQWQYTFSTYCSSNIHGINYRWRFIYPGTDIYEKVKNNPHMIKFDLNNLPDQMYQLASTANNKTIISQPLRLSAQQATIIPERFQPKKNNNNLVSSSHGLNKQRFALICLLIIAFIIFMLYFLSGKNDKVSPELKSENEQPRPQTQTIAKPINREGIAQNIDEHKIVKVAVNFNSPLSIVLNEKERREVKVKQSLSAVVNAALSAPSSTASTVKLQLRMEPETARGLAKKHGLNYNNQELIAETSVILNCDSAFETAINELENGIVVSEFVKPFIYETNSALIKKIKSQLAKSAVADNKDFYENSAEYLLGELYAEFKRYYMAFDIQRAGIIRQQRKQRSDLATVKKRLNTYNSELTDSGMERERKAALEQKRAKAKKAIATLLQKKKQLAGNLKTLKQSDVLIACRIALLQAFFCFGKNYMAEAEKIIEFDKLGADSKELRKMIKNSTIAQQLSYENEFKAILDGYVYRLTMKKTVIDAQSQLEKQHMRLEYNRVHKTFNLIIEDNEHERP